jgi:DNA-binding XRE family transcriptional regulator
MGVQFIEINGQRMAVLPEAEFSDLLEQLEDQDDERIASSAEERRIAGEEYVPIEVLDRLLAGDHPLKVWREFRGLSQDALANAAGLTKVSVSCIETGKNIGRVTTLRRFADILDVEMDDLVVDKDG